VRADQSDTRILGTVSLYFDLGGMPISFLLPFPKHLGTDILKQRPTTSTLISPVVEYLKTKTRSFEYTLGVLEKLENQARSEIARLGGNVGLERIIDALHVDGATLG
jgi:hypothetical protein